MKNEKGSTDLGLIGSLIVIILSLLVCWGWCLNIYKFASADFEAPYKTEIIRGVGIPFTPLGVIGGYMDIGEENKKPDN